MSCQLDILVLGFQAVMADEDHFSISVIVSTKFSSPRGQGGVQPITAYRIEVSVLTRPSGAW